jgi:hypothetical protein
VRESETRRRGRERGATEGDGGRQGEGQARDGRRIAGSERQTESGKEKNERDERNGGEKKPRVFLSSIQKFKIFFLLVGTQYVPHAFFINFLI